MPPLNFHQSQPDIGTSGQPTPEELHWIADEGYEVVINLAMPESDNALPDEGSLVTRLGMTYIHLPVPFDEPGASHLRDFIAIMSALSHRRIWVHCVINARVSAFMYQYLTLARDVDPETASSPLLKRWRPKMEPAWRSFLEITADELD